MKPLRAIIILLLVVSIPLPAFATALADFGSTRCDSVEAGATKNTAMDMDANLMAASSIPDCCDDSDCMEAGSCNTACASGATWVSSNHPQLNTRDAGNDHFAPLAIGISPVTPGKRLRPPISL